MYSGPMEELPSRSALKQGEVPLNSQACPEQRASWWSLLSFSWTNSIMEKGVSQQLTLESLWDLQQQNQTLPIETAFQLHLNKKLADIKKESVDKVAVPSNGSTEAGQREAYKTGFGGLVGQALFATFWTTFALGSICLFAADLLGSLGPVLLKKFIGVLRQNVGRTAYDAQNRLHLGGFYAFSLLGTQLAYVFTSQMHYHLLHSLAMRVRTAIISAVYRKSLRLSAASRQRFSAGEMVSLASSDARSLMVVTRTVPLLWSVPLQVVVAFILIRAEAGPSAACAGLIAMAALIPLSSWLAALQKATQASQMITRDSRIKVMSEIIGGIKVLKLHGWELGFKNVVSNIRDRELEKLSKLAEFESYLTLVWFIAPFMVSLVTFTAYALMRPSKESLGLEQALMCLALIQQLRAPLQQLPQVLSSLGQVSVSIRRLDMFFTAEEIEDYISNDDDPNAAIRFENATFHWGSPPPAKRDTAAELKRLNIRSSRGEVKGTIETQQNVVTLGPFNFNVPHGELLAIVGRVAQGKSSLLAALLGELQKLSGKVNVSGRVAFVPQAAWLRSGTLKDNILFGKPLNETRYRDVLRRCALLEDLKVLPAGDMTYLGNAGIGLSGGQKQRISLARAIYAGAEIYLFDDPLAAVDPQVGKHIFEHVISDKGILAGSTRVIVTQAVQFLSRMHKVAVIDGGQIIQHGPYAELLANREARFRALLRRISEQGEREREIQLLEEKFSSPKKIVVPLDPRLSITSDENDPDANIRVLSEFIALDSTTRLTTRECVQIKERPHIIREYLAHTGSAPFVWAVLALVASAAFEMGSTSWISNWNNRPYLQQSGWTLRLAGYSLLGALQGVCLNLGTKFIAKSGLRAARTLHDSILHKVLHAPFYFFDVTPACRVLSRFAGDLEDVELSLFQCLREWLQCFLQLLVIFTVICIKVPLFGILIIPLGIVYYRIQRTYLPTSSRLRNLEISTRTPILTHLSETIQGVTVIRAFRAQDMCTKQIRYLVDENNRCYYPYLCANRWLGVRLESLTTFVLFGTALLILFGGNLITPGAAGLCLSQALRLAGTFGVLVRVTASVTVALLSLNRLLQYLYLPGEANWEEESDASVPENWPLTGTVEFHSYSTRYRPQLPLVVRSISFRAEAGLRIGVVGRTGAGKSSLALALLRALEAVEGRITIDGVDIASLGLHTLRKKISIIPQDPVLFSGSLRLNLDPFGHYSNDDLWNTLEKSHLEDFVLKSPLGLDMAISEGGGNLSVGQRQLVCLARALLRRSKVVIFDEATASIDDETDRRIQEAVREEFVGSTIIAIAHRLHTVVTYDR
ncbi:canalicular multispecific organic anion transporter 1-like [Varroa destructor]|uniref:Uncharacterized protein n=1 Tax=Varroa destructor TaxID=109461 RepID=A0A7M7KVE3_VARDE|nr:canalicular multispecific organic anion transporter 1-like [Varroa destructor]